VPNFRTDCYGFWLWALADHIARGGQLDDTLTAGARLVIGYLLEAARSPATTAGKSIPATFTVQSGSRRFKSCHPDQVGPVAIEIVFDVKFSLKAAAPILWQISMMKRRPIDNCA
jgi:hypothetical protein